ncbi:MAG: hypothetical protein P8Y98_08305, partial [Anaerolineales bacterium]
MNNRIAEQEQDFVERLLPYVQRVMQVEDVSSGGKKEGFAARFRGRLTIDSQAAYDRLEPQFRSVGTTLFLHEDEGRHVVLAVPGLIDPSPSNPWINLLMFLLTLASVLYVGVLNAASYNMSEGVHGADIYLAQDYPLAIVYAGSILSILLAHEFGHY